MEYYALNCGERGIEIYEANKKPKLKIDRAVKVLSIAGKEKVVRIIKLGVKGGKLIGNWSPHHASLVLKYGEPGTITKVNSSVVCSYNASFNRVDQGA